MSDTTFSAGNGRVLAIANRAEIAVRIARTARLLGWRPVLLLGDPDLSGYAARTVGAVERVGPAGAELDPALVIAAAQRAGAAALHPGYGFLSEKPALAAACREAGITFVGPSPETLELCGDKVATREVALREGVPLLPAGETLPLADRAAWRRSAAAIGFPVIAKVAGGGGGRGLRVAGSAEELESAVDSVVRESRASGAGDRVYLERYLRGARHVEVQLAGDGTAAVALGDRDCSVQRRHQKVVEEAPAFGLSAEQRRALQSHAVTMARAVGLRGLATVEFLLGDDGTPAFIEINPRLQVEHTVTEEVTGLDLVALQLHLAGGGPVLEPPATHGHALQLRWYAEDPTRGFVPSPGHISVLELPRSGARIDVGYAAGDDVPSAYDPLIAKLIVRAPERAAAIDRLEALLGELRIAGISTNRPWLLALLANQDFRSAQHDLALAETIQVHESAPPLAALAALIAPTVAGDDAWADAGPFRMVGRAVRAFHGDEAGGWERRVRVQRGLVSDADGEEAVPAGTAPGTVAVPDDGGWELSAPAGRWNVRAGMRPREHAGERASDGVVRAPMPGTIATVHVAPGQIVEQGAVVAVMLAMKIEIALAAPLAGRVAAIDCAPGDLVNSRQALVTIRAEPSEGASGAGE